LHSTSPHRAPGADWGTSGDESSVFRFTADGIYQTDIVIPFGTPIARLSRRHLAPAPA